MSEDIFRLITELNLSHEQVSYIATRMESAGANFDDVESDSQLKKIIEECHFATLLELNSDG